MIKPKIFEARGRIITEILGRNKYTNYQQALNEAVANSLDAKANKITININKDHIEIIDDGVGMSEDDLMNRYFTLGERNPDPQARALFGIGVCANAALGDVLIVESRPRRQKMGVKAVVNFQKVEQFNVGEYKPEVWENINFDDKKYSTLIRVEKLRWSSVNSEEVYKFLIEKHWPLLVDKDLNTQIEVAGKSLKAEEPKDVEKYTFNNLQEFRIGDKLIPPTNLDCGKVEGHFYLKEDGFSDPSIDVYVKNQRIDTYSGDQVDWLRIKDLSSAEGFRRRLKGIIKVEATDEADWDKRSPLDRNILKIKSDRSGFFEESFAFKHLRAYLNEKSKGSMLKLPYGGVLRLINSEWYHKRGIDISKTQELIHKLEPDLKRDLGKIFEDEKLQTKINPAGGEIKQVREKPTEKTLVKPENVLFRCPICQDLLRIKIAIYQEWLNASKEKRNVLRIQQWQCKSCGHLLDPSKDKYRRGPIRGKELMKITLEEGMITHILADAMGKNGPKSLYLIEDNAITINAEHAMLVYSLKTSDEAFKCYLLDALIYAIAIRRSMDKTTEYFQENYNQLSAKINNVIDIEEYEEALEKLRVAEGLRRR